MTLSHPNKDMIAHNDVKLLRGRRSGRWETIMEVGYPRKTIKKDGWNEESCYLSLFFREGWRYKWRHTWVSPRSVARTKSLRLGERGFLGDGKSRFRGCSPKKILTRLGRKPDILDPGMTPAWRKEEVGHKLWWWEYRWGLIGEWRNRWVISATTPSPSTWPWSIPSHFFLDFSCSHPRFFYVSHWMSQG